MTDDYYRNTGLPPEVRHVTIIYRFIFTALLTPMYVRILMILLRNTKFRSNMAYILIVNIGVCDILLLLTMLWAGVISIDERTIGHVNLQFVTKAASYYRCLYFIAYFSFSILLALNRLFIILEWNVFKDWMYKCAICLLWPTIIVVFPILFEYNNVASEYDCDFAMFVSIGFMVEKVVMSIEIPLFASILACYMFVIATLVFKVSLDMLTLVKWTFQRKRFNQEVRLSSPEGRLALQTALLFIPQGVVFAFMKIMQSRNSNFMSVMVYMYPELIAVVNILFDALPFSFLAVLITFNTTASLDQGNPHIRVSPLDPASAE
uniref:G_PROTEIN_RECEP_F1_2 domain-containing protein n=1 Tax=Steinernema glaseri TaxID=37863 RepID=A0A1I7YNV5_9BILA